MTHPDADVRRVLELAAQGLNHCQVARVTGINRSTVREWITSPPSDRPSRRNQCPICTSGATLEQQSYVYLLGLYLGDGTISRQPKDVWRLRIFQDQRYPDLIAEAVAAIGAVLPNNVLVQQRPGCVEIGASSKHWPCLFPQHGPGMKHTRPIVLADWQQALVDAHPKLLLRGLIHSDGCRGNNFAITRGRRYDYVRYQFTNASDDIRGIFTNTCDALGVHWTQMNARNISVARRADVAFLDSFIGPKS